MSQIFCLTKDTSQPRQNCFGKWIEHCRHCSYLSHEWRHSRCHWEILDEEVTLLKSIIKKWHFTRAAVPFRIPFLEKVDGERRSSWGRKKLMSFSLIHRREKQKFIRTVAWICWDFITAWMSSTLPGQWLWIPASVTKAPDWAVSWLRD